MKKIYSKFDKAAIAQLPRALFEGRVVTIEGEYEAERAVDFLLAQPILGFDTETRPNFKSGGMNPVALLQVSSRDTCFLFRLNHIGLPSCLLRLLSDREVLKVAISWKDDVHQLMRRQPYESGVFVELQQLVEEYGIKDKSLQKLYANLFAQKISKTQRLTNWEASTLSEAQKRYAATDAWACIMIYDELQRLRRDGYELVVLPEPDPAPATPAEPKVEVATSEPCPAAKKGASAAKRSRPKRKKTTKPNETTPAHGQDTLPKEG